MGRWIVLGVFGAIFGASLSFIGFTSYEEVHKMFTFADPRLIFVFAGATCLAGAGFFATGMWRELSPRPIHRGTLLGGMLFGVGWALTGACPGVVFAQLGEGQWITAYTLIGILIGTASYRRVHGRFFRWDRGSCDV